jgi:hypothetical protein
MENESKMWPAESGPAYEAPRVDVLEVMVERGFTISIEDVNYNGTSLGEDEFDS